MLEGTLYRILSKEEGSATLLLLPESPIYKAHFPGYPITPGVTLVQMAMDVMGKTLQAARDIKFVAPVFPTAEGTQIRYEWSYKDSSTALVSVFLSDGTLCAKMTLSV